MTKFALQLTGSAALCLSTTLAQAQAYGPPITLEQAKKVMAAAEAEASAYDIVCFVDLSEIRDAGLVDRAVADGLGIHESPQRPPVWGCDADELARSNCART